MKKRKRKKKNKKVEKKRKLKKRKGKKKMMMIIHWRIDILMSETYANNLCAIFYSLITPFIRQLIFAHICYFLSPSFIFIHVTFANFLKVDL